MTVISRIAEINRECFMGDDPYSSKDYLKRLKQSGVKFLVVRMGGEIVGYLIYQELKTHIESLRRGLTKRARGRGLGVRLSKRLISIANERGKDIYTYVSKSNLPSLNSNLKCGYRIENISEDWVYIRYKAT